MTFDELLRRRFLSRCIHPSVVYCACCVDSLPQHDNWYEFLKRTLRTLGFDVAFRQQKNPITCGVKPYTINLTLVSQYLQGGGRFY